MEDGTGKTTQRHYVNRNKQECLGTRYVEGTDHGQWAYKMRCQQGGHLYGANGTDVFQRKCPDCQGGQPGIPY